MMSPHARKSTKLKSSIPPQKTKLNSQQHNHRDLTASPTQAFMVLVKLFILALLSNTAWAIESDRNAPIEIQADSAKISEAKQTAIYKGNVELVQGTLKIICDQLTVFNSAEGVERVEAQGRPASYSQKMSLDKPHLDAAAGKIIYLPASARIRLEGNAKIKQGGNVFEGQLIEYDLEQQVLMASGDNGNAKQNDSKEKQRVKMTLQPQPSP